MEQIVRPAYVSLIGEILTWEVLYRNGSATAGLVPVSPQGCLAAFVKLADGGAPQVHAFCECWGTLALDPWVWTAPNSGQASERRHYAELAEVYTRLARMAKAILFVKNRLWAEEKGNGEQIGREWLRACFSEKSEAMYLASLNAEDLQPRDKYATVCLAVRLWAMQARCEVSLPPWPGNLRTCLSAGVLSVRFGHWDDGDNWDADRLRWHSLDSGSQGKAVRRNLNRARKKTAGLLPNSHQRPSPLFSALTFQLQREVCLPAGARVCLNINCPDPVFTPDKGEHQDKKYCSDKCKGEHLDSGRRR